MGLRVDRWWGVGQDAEKEEQNKTKAGQGQGQHEIKTPEK